ncbi:hypothetical protein [Mesorhizobium sp. RIZ17]|uniref:hypothetical protein n=1 Tax=Mesorhizobium sp. RIZ17 TaxID=3132743 RepID=UPI003DA7E5CE
MTGKGDISLTQMRDLCAIHWNPIGMPMANLVRSSELRSRPLPEDEYDTYLLHVIRLVRDGATPSQIVDYLSTAEKEYMGLTSPRGSKDIFVNAVFELAEQIPTK